jgi:hypothetical protein
MKKACSKAGFFHLPSLSFQFLKFFSSFLHNATRQPGISQVAEIFVTLNRYFDA